MTSSEAVIVSNSGPLIALAEIGCFHLLSRLFDRIAIPQAVYDEVVTRGGNEPGASETREADFIELVTASNPVAVGFLSEELGAGESEAIVLAQQVGAALVLLDDGRARRTALRAGLPTIGTLGILLLAKRAGLIPAVRPLLEALRQQGFRVGRSVFEQALAAAGES